MAGHKTESIYRYAIVDPALQREAAARLDAHIGASGTDDKIECGHGVPVEGCDS
jgi:hypothetical protein